MNYNKTIVIFPKDPTLDFILPVFDFLSTIVPEINIFRPTEELPISLFPKDTEIVIFIGHGASDKLHGYSTSTKDKVTLLNKKDKSLSFFTGKKLFFLACRSEEFIYKISKIINLDTCIGFGDMPTDWNHICYYRDMDSELYKYIKEEHLVFYRDTITEIIFKALKVEKSDFYNIYLDIIHAINKKIDFVIFHSEWDKYIKIELIGMLSELRDNCTYFQKDIT